MRKLDFFFKYTIVNGIIILLNYFLYIVLIKLFSVTYLVSNIISYMIVVIVAYFFNRKFVFQTVSGGREFLEFILMKLLLGFISVLMLWLFVDRLQFGKNISFFLTAGSLFIVSFFFSRWIFLFLSEKDVLIRLLRIKHWIKNILIFIPGICAGRYLEHIDNVYTSLLAFGEFCFFTSGVYIINDLADIRVDRLNPRKKHEPIASGVISTREAIKYLCICFMLGILISVFLGSVLQSFQFWILQSLVLMYLMINVCYNFMHLKEKPVLELMLVLSGYVIRLAIGGVISYTSISRYLLLTISLLCLYMILNKRFYDKKACTSKKAIIEKYSLEWLNTSKTVCCCLSIVYYSFWAMEMFDSIIAALLILGMLGFCLAYSYDLEKMQEGDPITVIYRDKCLFFLGVFYVIVVVWLHSFL